MPAKGIVEMSQIMEAATREWWPELSALSSQTAVGGSRMTPERLEEIKKNVDLWLDDDGSVVELITALEEAEADRDKWMGQFDEAEHRGLAYMEERDKLAAQVKLLESDLKNSHACWDAACEDITKYKARVKELAGALQRLVLVGDLIFLTDELEQDGDELILAVAHGQALLRRYPEEKS